MAGDDEQKISSGCARAARLQGKPRAVLLAAVLATLLASCASDQTGAILKPAAIQVPSEAPRITGRRFNDESDHAKLVASFGGEYRSLTALSLLTDVTNRLVRVSDRPDETYAVTLLDSPAINAFALPSGRLYVTRGLLALASDTSEVAAVLAHEIAHVSLRHASARSELALRSKLVSRVVADVLNDPTTGAQMESQSRFSLARFSRDQEHEADAVGVRVLSAAGYDPFGAARFLTALNRTILLKGPAGAAGEPDMLATHPGTTERVTLVTRAARRIGAPGLGVDERRRYLAAIDGLAYGDNPGEGIVRAGRFLHPGLGVAFEVPIGFAIENTRNAVLGTTRDGTRRMLFDQVDSRTGQSLEEVLKSTWNDTIDAGSIETRMASGHAVAIATSRGKDWTFRLAAVRIGESTFRMIMASKGTADPGPAFNRWIESLTTIDSAEARSLQPSRLKIVTATGGDTAESLSARMTVPDRPLERFLVLNGLERGTSLQPGQGYKLVADD